MTTTTTLTHVHTLIRHHEAEHTSATLVLRISEFLTDTENGLLIQANYLVFLTN